jgi:ABC-type Zn uptake system ZnuABC Zn-binding protein ZnuA
MRTTWVLGAWLAGASGLSAVAAGSEPAAKKPRVVCTTTMITDLAQAIAGDAVEVHGIMRAGEDPHVYDVRPRDVQLIAEGDLILLNGLHLEATLNHVIEHNAKGKVVRLAETPQIVPLESEQTRGAPDPHCWFNVQYFRVYAERARDAMVEADPKNAAGYRQRTEAYLKELDELHQWVKKEIEAIPRERRVMVTSHDAFQYFGRTYFIDVFAVIGISTEQQPKPQDVQRLESIVRERGVKALFIETSVSKTLNDIVQKVAEATNTKIGGTLYSDSLGPLETPAGTYLGMIRHNTRTVVDALR